MGKRTNNNRPSLKTTVKKHFAHVTTPPKLKPPPKKK